MAEAVVHKRAAVAVPTDPAVRMAVVRMVVVHMAGEVVADSIDLGVAGRLGESEGMATEEAENMVIEESGGMATENMQTGAVDLGAAGEVYCSPTAPEDRVTMSRRNWERGAG